MPTERSADELKHSRAVREMAKSLQPAEPREGKRKWLNRSVAAKA